MGYRFSSPALYERAKRAGVADDAYAYSSRCPVGRILREAPHVYEWINIQSYAEAGALNPLDLPGCVQQALGVISSEKERLRRRADGNKQAASDADYGARVRSRHG